METATGNMDRLPEEVLATVISFTSPRDACRAAAVSRAFCAAVNSDAVWSHFLPADLPELAATPQSKKALFKCLCDKPARLPCRDVSVQLDRATGAMSYMPAKPYEIPADEAPVEEDDETPVEHWDQQSCGWISLGCGDIQRNKRFQSFQSAFWTS